MYNYNVTPTYNSSVLTITYSFILYNLYVRQK